jgi:ferric-dicitrate binding protein FerR (iron transport regulator)
MTSGWDAWGQDDDWERWTARPSKAQREIVERVPPPSREGARLLAVLTGIGVVLWIAGLCLVAQRATAWDIPLGGLMPVAVAGTSPDQLEHIRGLWGMLQLTTLPVMLVLFATAAWSSRRRRARWCPAVAMALSAVGTTVGVALVLQGMQTWSLSR